MKRSSILSKKRECLLVIILSWSIYSCNSHHKSSAFSDTVTVADTVFIHDTVFIEMENEASQEVYYIQERLPWWIVESEIMEDLIIDEKYRVDNRLNPLYLEEDFNGDGFYDLSVPIIEMTTGKVGFAIIHGETKEIYIIGAGSMIENGLSDDMSYIDIWRINREEVNPPGLNENGEVDPAGPLHTKLPTIEIEASEVGGGLLYWKGNAYAYFHQTC